jgi:transcriptional regulator with XRE-family HTH domain
MFNTNGAPRARALAAKLRSSREAGSMGVREVARKLGVSHSVVSYWETGKRVPSLEDVASYLTAINVRGEEKNWILELARSADARDWFPAGIPGISQAAAAVMECERTATDITEWSQNVVPGLLQTSGYAREIIGAGDTPRGEVEARVMVRASRRDVITRPEPVRFTALIGENAVRDPVGSPVVQSEQLRYLVKLAGWENIAIRIVRSGQRWHPGMAGSFVLYDFENLPPVVLLEHYRSSGFLYESDATAEYKAAEEWIRGLALSAEESAELIAEVAEEMERATR